MISLGLLLLLVSLSLGLYSVESSHPNTRIDSFGDAFWYMIVTMTTVGYGDVYPVTFLGRLIGAVFVIGSLGVLGFLIGQVANVISNYRERKRLGLNGTDFSNHVVVIGWNELSKVVTEKLLETGREVALLVETMDNFELADNHYDDDNVFLCFADHLDEESFERANLTDANSVLVNRAGDAENLITILSIKEFDQDARTIVCVYNEELIKTFRSAGASYVLSRQDVLAQIIANYITSPEDEIFTQDFIETAEEDGVLQISDS